jgi:hypothetical protein
MRWALSLSVVDLLAEDAEQIALVRGHANDHVPLSGKPCWDTKPPNCRCPDLLTSSAHRFLRFLTCCQQHAASLWNKSQHRSACLTTKAVATDRLTHDVLVRAAAMWDSTVQLVAMVQAKRTPSSVSLEREQEDHHRIMIVSSHEPKFNVTLGLT